MTYRSFSSKLSKVLKEKMNGMTERLLWTQWKSSGLTAFPQVTFYRHTNLESFSFFLRSPSHAARKRDENWKLFSLEEMAKAWS